MVRGERSPDPQPSFWKWVRSVSVREGSELRKAAFDGMIWGIGGKLLLIVSNFAVLMVTSRALSAAEFGVFAAAGVFTDLSWAVATSTFGVALVQRKDLSVDQARAGFYAFLVISLGFSAFISLFAKVLEFFLKSPGLANVLYVLAIFIPFKIMTGFYGAILQRRLDMRFYQLTQNLPQVIGSCAVTAVMAIKGFGVWSLVGGYGAASLLEFGMTAFRAGIDIRPPSSFRSVGGLLQIGSVSIVHRMTNFAATNADRLIIGSMLGAASLGIYSRAYSLMMVPVKLLGFTINRTFLAVFSHMQTDESRLRRALQRVIEVQTIFYLPIGIGFIFATPLIVRVVLGEQWLHTVPLAQIFFSALFARLGYVALEMASFSVGEIWSATGRQLAYAAMVIVGGVAASLFGLTGMVWGVTAALIAFYALSLRRVIVRFGCSVKVILTAHFRAIAIAAVAAAAALLSGMLCASMHWPSPYNVVQTFVYWAAFGLMLLISPAKLVGEELVSMRRAARGVVLKKMGRSVTGSSVYTGV